VMATGKGRGEGRSDEKRQSGERRRKEAEAAGPALG
jgi:hypothetical protein